MRLICSLISQIKSHIMARLSTAIEVDLHLVEIVGEGEKLASITHTGEGSDPVKASLTVTFVKPGEV